MSRLLLDHNPLSGETVWFSHDEHTNQITITHEQDVSKHLDLARSIAADTSITQQGIKNDVWRYAHVPNSILLEMRQKHGVDFMNRNHQQKFFDLLNTEYKEFKTTTKYHRPRNG